MNITPDTTQLGALAIIFLFAIKEFFAWLKIRKNKNGVNKQILGALTQMNENHLNSICKAITEGNIELTKAINEGHSNTRKAITDMHKDLIEILGEIKGRLR